MTLDELAAEIPGIAEKLGKLLVDEGFGALRHVGASLGEMSPAVSIVFEPKDGTDRFKVTLSIDIDDGSDDDEIEDFDGDDQ